MSSYNSTKFLFLNDAVNGEGHMGSTLGCFVKEVLSNLGNEVAVV
jgi:hypothetical protein